MQDEIQEVLIKVAADLAVVTKSHEIRCVGLDGKEYGIGWDVEKNQPQTNKTIC